MHRQPMPMMVICPLMCASHMVLLLSIFKKLTKLEKALAQRPATVESGR
jgi:hypothetical protein